MWGHHHCFCDFYWLHIAVGSKWALNIDIGPTTNTNFLLPTWMTWCFAAGWITSHALTVQGCMLCHDTIRQVSTRYLYVILVGYHGQDWDVCCAVLLPVNVGRRTCGCIVSKEKKRTCGCSGSLCYRNPGESILGLTRCKKQARGFQESLWMWLASAFSKVFKALEC